MPLDESQLQALAQQEAHFFGGIATIVEEQCGLFLFAPNCADYVGANRALALRDDGRGAQAVAETVTAFYRERGIRPAADLDAMSEAQGIGAELRRRGLRSAIANRVLMRYAAAEPPTLSSPTSVERISNDSPDNWLEIAVSHENSEADKNEWRDILRYDARTEAHQLYLAYHDRVPTACCQLFCNNGYGRIDDVTTRPDYQRRGLAAAVVAHAVSVSLQANNHTTFLYCDADSPAESLYRKLGFEIWERNPFRRIFTPAP